MNDYSLIYAHLVEEDRPAGGFLEVALAVGDRTCEGALEMPKELGVDGALRDRPTVHRYIRAMLADAILMDDLGEVLLTHTTLSDH